MPPSALDGQVSLNKAIIQLPGTGETLDVAHFREVAEQKPGVATTLLRHEQVLFAQAQQSAACNAVSHRGSPVGTLAATLTRSLRQRYPRADPGISREMLGVRRSSVSPVADALQQAGLIRYSRGHIEILDLEGLRSAVLRMLRNGESPL